MKTQQPVNRRRSGLLLLAGIVLAVVALLAWSGRARISSWYATSYEGSVFFTTADDPDASRLNRAFEQASRATQADAQLVPQSTSSHFHKGVIRIAAPTDGQATAAAQAFSAALAAAFGTAGPERLWVESRRVADPLPNATTTAWHTALVIGAPLLGLVALALMVRGWSGVAQNLPKYTGIYAGIGVGLAAGLILLPGWVLMALFAGGFFVAIAGVIVYNAHQAQAASHWPTTRGRIMHSGMQRAQRAGAGNSTVGNMPNIEYVYSVGGTEYHGNRIRGGSIIADSAEATSAPSRYPVGRETAVYYNPTNPQDAVLEPGAPLRTRTAYMGAAAIVLGGLAIVAAFTRIGEVIPWLQPHFPEGAVVQGVLFFGAAGLLGLYFVVSDYRQASAALQWPKATGTVISSAAQAQRRLVSGRGGTTVKVWSPAIEFSYRVAGQDYHGARIAFGAAVSGSKEWADAIVARYRPSQSVVVSYDPANPAIAVLEPRVAFKWGSLAIVAGCFAAAFFFSGFWKFL